MPHPPPTSDQPRTQTAVCSALPCDASAGNRVPWIAGFPAIFVAGAIAAVNAVVAIFRLPETKPDTSHIPATHGRRGALTPALQRFAIVGFLSMLGFAGFESTFSLWGKENVNFGFTSGTASLVFVFVGFTLVGVQGGLIGPLTDIH